MQNQAVHYKQNPDFIYREIVDEMILVPIHNDIADMDCIYSLNPQGAFIWEKLSEPATKAEITTAILENFDGDPEVVQQDTEAFIQDLLHYGAIKEEA